MPPCLFEVLISLKCNIEWWNPNLDKEIWEGLHNEELKDIYHDYDENSNGDDDDDDDKME